MVKNELEGILAIEDLIAVFRSAPKIVEVEKII
jgi:hypothetical protein